MSVLRTDYESLLAECSNTLSAIEILKQHRPYFELIPSLRRPQDSAIAIPLPIVRVREAIASIMTHGDSITAGSTVPLPCEVALLMCDPEWKIKTGVEILLFIHRPYEEFSDLLRRWRQTQMWLDKGYEWILPQRYNYLLGEGGDRICPLFILFPKTPERIQKGLRGAALPFLIYEEVFSVEEEELEDVPSPSLE